jgi:hypothetical protein
MSFLDYTHTVNQSITAPSASELRWAYILAVLAKLKNDPVAPYVVRGSSRNGSSGAAFSATPDGVDRWTGTTQAATAGAGNPIWIVLQNTLTGHQVCFLLGTSSGPVSVVTVVFAMNKFETGGVWRGGGTGTATRPTDVTSSPVAARELATSGSTGLSPQTLTNQYYNVSVRMDGKGFYASLFRDTTPDLSSDGNFMGYFPLNTPATTDLNPYLAFITNNAGLNGNSVPPLQGGGSCSMVGRLQDGTSQEHSCMDFGAITSNSYLDQLDPWMSAYAMHGVAVRSNTTHAVRLWMPDIFICSGPAPASSNFATRDSKKYFRLTPNNGAGSFGVIIPWDGSTTRGTDVPVFKVPSSIPDGPVVVSADFKHFNLGLEKI